MVTDAILLVSGGLDSWATHWLLQESDKPHKLLFVNLGCAYQSKELRAVNSLRERLGCAVRIVDFPSIGRYEKQNAEIPQRNLMLAQIALLEFPDANRIYLAIQKGETVNESNDRSPVFFRRASSMLSHLYGREVRVSSPILDLTKRQLFLKIHGSGTSTDWLSITTSCYHPSEQRCGRCPSCLRRFAATWPELQEDYNIDPVIGNFKAVKDWYLPEMLKSKHTTGRYDPQRAEEFLSFLDSWMQLREKEWPSEVEQLRRIRYQE